MIAPWIAVLLLMPALSGCVGLAVAGAGAAAFGQGKTPIDHTVSWIEGKDCSSIRSRQGLTYCVEDERQPPYSAHCFRTLGEVTCYTEQRPYPGRQAALFSGTAATDTAPAQDLAAANRPLAATPSNRN